MTEAGIEVVASIPAVASRQVGTLDAHLVQDWLASKSERTRVAYRGDLARFSQWLGFQDLENAVRALVAGGPTKARHQALEYRRHMEDKGLSPATINRGLAALRSVVDLARDCGQISWKLNVKGLRARAYRDTKGPSRELVGRILAAADVHSNPAKSARDGALLRLLYGLALRRAEAVGLDLRHVELEERRVWVLGKGCHDREPMTLPLPVTAALARWLEAHPGGQGETPLFVALDRATGSGIRRLRARSVARVLKAYCESAGVPPCPPHALRHAAITHALDATNGDFRRVRAFSRHAKLETLAVYDDNRLDGAAEVAALVAQ